ncbi:MAG: hypothetical protein ACYSWU_01200 [Planctomycetota bacterium]|jgi:hypothetical protein
MVTAHGDRDVFYYCRGGTGLFYSRAATACKSHDRRQTLHIKAQETESAPAFVRAPWEKQ